MSSDLLARECGLARLPGGRRRRKRVARQRPVMADMGDMETCIRNNNEDDNLTATYEWYVHVHLCMYVKIDQARPAIYDSSQF